MADKYNLNKDDLPKGVGTGFIWDKKGHIITNFHVINKVDNAIITITDKNNIKKNNNNFLEIDRNTPLFYFIEIDKCKEMMVKKLSTRL